MVDADPYLGEDCLAGLKQDFIQDMNMVLALSTHGPVYVFQWLLFT